MTAPLMAPGEAIALVRPLPRPVEPLSLYAALTDKGSRRDTMLILCSDGPTLILDEASLRVECRGQEVMVTAFGASGHAAMEMIAQDLADRVVTKSPEHLRLHFPKVEGIDPAERLTAPSPFDALRTLTLSFRNGSADEPFTLAALGVVAYDHVDLLEELPAAEEDPLGFPDFLFWLAASLVVIENDGSARAITTAFGGPAGDEEKAYHDSAERLRRLVDRCSAAAPLQPPVMAPDARPCVDVDLSDSQYAALVRRMKAHIAAGDVYQIVPSRTFSAPCTAPFDAFALLRQQDPSPYLFYFAGPDHLLFGASPEMSVRVQSGANGPIVEVKPIAGTRPPGRHGGRG